MDHYHIVAYNGLIFGIWSLIIKHYWRRGSCRNREYRNKCENKESRRIRTYKTTKKSMLFGGVFNISCFALFINSITLYCNSLCNICCFMLTVVVKMEEKRLLKRFGNQYEEYRKRYQCSFRGFKEKSNRKE